MEKQNKKVWKYFWIFLIILGLIALAFYLGYRHGVDVVRCDMIHHAYVAGSEINPPFCGKTYP